jgi:hypothetical protein
MNERLKELAEQSGMHYRETSDEFCEANKDGVPFEMLERFAELVRLEETKACAKHYLEIMRDAVEQAVLKEREACAALVEGGNHVHPKAPDAVWAKTVAKLIRARGNHDTKR